MSIAFTFPGQGSQQVGMGKDLADEFQVARDVFNEVDEALGKSLTKIMWEGPADELTLTENAQPALMAVSIAVMRCLENEFGLDLASKVKYVAGHSLGEYSALAAAGTFTLTDTAQLLRIRGKSMQAAVPVNEGAMAALLGLDLPDAIKLAEKASIAEDGSTEVCNAANDNAPGQVVLSGHRAAIERAVELASEFGARRAVLLDVSAPFHCSLMQPAADAMKDALSNTEMKNPVVPLVANTLATAITDADAIREGLVNQVTGQVRWRESVEFMAANGITTLYEIGSGRVLTGLARRIERSLEANSIGAPDDIKGAAETFGA
ncbi:MAG: malonyl CoA-acyl carrier protein transacylase [Methyloligella sp.]|nr:MAG: malonyl CoA-acyl carrier protein transacylase [Methyloligella sp.]